MTTATMAHDNKSILVVEDDPAIASTLTDVLETSGYKVWQAETGAEAKAVLDQNRPDLIVLDLMLPDVDGLVLCSNLKATRDVPVIICSAMNQPRDRVLGLKLGADDFIGKPFDIYELEARVEAVLRRHEKTVHTTPPPQSGRPSPQQHSSGGIMRVGSLEIDPARRKVTLGGKTLLLTPTEYRLLCTMVSHPNEILSREELTRLVWGFTDASAGRTIDVHIRRLRMKLSDGPVPAPSIVSQRGFGYGVMDDAGDTRSAA